MTKDNSLPTLLENRIAEAPASTTVFSDGSTFDYENGYKSNGAPTATRDRSDNPTIVKTHKIFTSNLVFSLAVWTLLLTAAAIALFGAISNVQKRENINFVKAEMLATGQVNTVEYDKDVLIFQNKAGDVLKCDLVMLSNGDSPVAHIFCAEGQPAVLSIPLPNDPSNIFYSAPKNDDLESNLSH